MIPFLDLILAIKISDLKKVFNGKSIFRFFLRISPRIIGHFFNYDDNLFISLILFVYTTSNIDVIKNTTIPPIIIIPRPDWSIFSRHFLNWPMRRENSWKRKVWISLDPWKKNRNKKLERTSEIYQNGRKWKRPYAGCC